MSLEFRTTQQLQRDGIKALTQELGNVDAIRFLKLFDNGGGDYTEERKKLYDHMTVDELSEKIMKWQNEKQ